MSVRRGGDQRRGTALAPRHDASTGCPPFCAAVGQRPRRRPSDGVQADRPRPPGLPGPCRGPAPPNVGAVRFMGFCAAAFSRNRGVARPVRRPSLRVARSVRPNGPTARRRSAATSGMYQPGERCHADRRTPCALTDDRAYQQINAHSQQSAARSTPGSSRLVTPTRRGEAAGVLGVDGVASCVSRHRFLGLGRPRRSGASRSAPRS